MIIWACVVLDLQQNSQFCRRIKQDALIIVGQKITNEMKKKKNMWKYYVYFV